MAIFEIHNVVCDAKRLPEIFEALAGKTITKPYPVPVIAEVKKNGELVESAGNLVDLFKNTIMASDATQITIQEVKAWLKQHGRSALSSDYIMRNAKDQKFVKATKKRGVYSIVR